MSRVLVVDDDADIRDILMLNLAAEGHEVTTACDGAAALEAARTSRPDLVFLDVRMPSPDGFEVLNALKRDVPDVAGIPVVMITALAQPDDRIRGGLGGALRYVVKPFDPVEVVALVDELLDADAGTEAERRRAVQRAALSDLAELHTGRDVDPFASVSLTELERRRDAQLDASSPALPLDGERLEDVRGRLELLTSRQSELLGVVAITATVSDAARSLGTSRANVYASLSRIGSRLGVGDTSDLLRMARAGALSVP